MEITDKMGCVGYVIDFKENASYSLVDSNYQNKATAVIHDENITVYFKDRSTPKEFGNGIDKFLSWIKDNDLLFIKLTGEKRWHEFNPNPKQKKIGDCTLRAYCAAFNISWEEAFDIASEIAKENASMIQYVSDKVLTQHFGCTLDENYNKKKVKAKDRITIAEFATTHPYGVYILSLRNHLVTLRNGEYWDSWDCGDKKLDAVYNVTEN